MNRSKPLINFFLSVPLILFSLCTVSPAQELIFPRVDAEDLNGKAVILPKDLPGNPTVILVAFIRKQQGEIDQWIEALELKNEASSTEWIELPYVGSNARPFKAFIDKGMKSGITSAEARARTITVYEDHKIIVDALKLKGLDRIYVIVAEPGGKIRTLVEGTPDEEKKQSVLSALTKD
jgi:hypothetical protein